MANDNWVKIPTIQPIKINKNVLVLGEEEQNQPKIRAKTKKPKPKNPKRKRRAIRAKKVWLPKCIRADPLIKMLFS